MFDSFINFSVTITGYTAFRLQGTGMAASYFEKVESIIGTDTLSALLTQFQDISIEASGDAEVLDKLLRETIFSNPKFGPVTRNIIKLWYIGTWYQLPGIWREAYGTSELDTNFVVSPSSYCAGLLWPTVGATPAGAKAPGYDSWSTAPVI